MIKRQSSAISLQHIKLKALIEHKQLKLRSLQQKLRKDVAMEQRLLKDCHPSMLMDWGRCRRADPEVSEPDMNYRDPAPKPEFVAKPSQAAQIEIARSVAKQSKQSAFSHCLCSIRLHFPSSLSVVLKSLPTLWHTLHVLGADTGCWHCENGRVM